MLCTGVYFKNFSGINRDIFIFYSKYFCTLENRVNLPRLLMSMITGKKVTDSTNGFRAFRLSIFDHPEIDIKQQWLNQYELEPYLMYKAIKLGFKFCEASVTKIYPPKKLGYTKMKPLIGWWSILKPLFYLGLGIKK